MSLHYGKEGCAEAPSVMSPMILWSSPLFHWLSLFLRMRRLSLSTLMSLCVSIALPSSWHLPSWPGHWLYHSHFPSSDTQWTVTQVECDSRCQTCVMTKLFSGNHYAVSFTFAANWHWWRKYPEMQSLKCNHHDSAQPCFLFVFVNCLKCDRFDQSHFDRNMRVVFFPVYVGCIILSLKSVFKMSNNAFSWNIITGTLNLIPEEQGKKKKMMSSSAQQQILVYSAQLPHFLQWFGEPVNVTAGLTDTERSVRDPDLILLSLSCVS